MGFSIDKETLAVTVIIGAAALYYFGHDVQTDEQVQQKKDDDKKAIAIRNLDLLERRFDALNLQDLPKGQEIPLAIGAAISQILKDSSGLLVESKDIKGLDTEFYEHIEEIVRSSMHYLARHVQEMDDRKAHEAHQKGVCPTNNVAVVTKIAVTHNHFDVSAIDARTVQVNIDERSLNFQTQNNELRQLNVRNPHSEHRGSDVRSRGNTGQQLSHVTNAGSNNQSINDQAQTNRDNIVAVGSVSGCGTHWRPSSSASLKTLPSHISYGTPDPPSIIPASDQSARHAAEIAHRIGGAVRLGSVAEVDLFQSAPPRPADNHDKSPAVMPVPPAGAGDSLVEGTDAGMFDEGGKSGRKTKRLEFREGERPAKKIRGVPPSPTSVAQKISAVNMFDLQGKIRLTIRQLQGTKEYVPELVKTVEGYITALDHAVHSGGTESDKKTYGKYYIDSLNRYKKKFGVAVVKMRQRWV